MEINLKEFWKGGQLNLGLGAVSLEGAGLNVKRNLNVDEGGQERRQRPRIAAIDVRVCVCE